MPVQLLKKYVRNKEIKNEENKEKVNKITVLIENLLCSTKRYPLSYWTKYVKRGFVKRVNDEEIEDKVLEILGPPNSVWIETPRKLGTNVGTNFQWLFFIVKAFPKKPMVIDIQVLDSSNKKRAFKLYTKGKSAKWDYHMATLEIDIVPGIWTLLEVDLYKLVDKHYRTYFVELCGVRVHGSCRLLRIYTSSSHLDQDELPQGYVPRATNGDCRSVYKELAKLLNKEFRSIYPK